MRRFGKKIFADPTSARTGFLSRMSGKAEIGNKAMLRAVDSLLQMENTAGTPSILGSTEVVPVIDIRAAARKLPIRRYIEDSFALIGNPAWTFTAYQPPDGQYAEVMAADMTINFVAAPGAGNQLNMAWELADFPPNGTDTRIPVGGYVINNMLGTEAGLQAYRAPLACASVGGSASPPWIAMRGRLYGQNFPVAPSDPLGLYVTVGYFTGGNVPQNFPAATLITKVWALEYPPGEIPVT